MSDPRPPLATRPREDGDDDSSLMSSRGPKSPRAAEGGAASSSSAVPEAGRALPALLIVPPPAAAWGMPGGLFSPPAGDVAFGVGGGSFAPPATVGAPLTPLAISREFFENKVRVDVEWDGASTDKVAVTGAFIGWAAPGVSLTYMDGRWTGSVFIEKGAFPAHIKFIVNGVWRTSSNMDVITDGAGNVNNLVHPVSGEGGAHASACMVRRLPNPRPPHPPRPTPQPYAFPNWVGYWHITNPESPYCAPGARPPEYAAMEALEDEDAMMRRLCSVAGFAFDKRMRTADRLRLIRDRLCTSPAAYIDACKQAFVPWLADAAIEGVGDVLVHPVRSYVVTAKAPPPKLIKDMNAVDRTLFTVRQRTGDLEYQPDCAYDKGYLYTLDKSKYDAMVLEAAAGDDPDVYVPAIPFAMLAWQQGHLHLALLLFGLAFPGCVRAWGVQERAQRVAPLTPSALRPGTSCGGASSLAGGRG